MKANRILILNTFLIILFVSCKKEDKTPTIVIPTVTVLSH